jgi:hypothetical protein
MGDFGEGNEPQASRYDVLDSQPSATRLCSVFRAHGDDGELQGTVKEEMPNIHEVTCTGLKNYGSALSMILGCIGQQ